MSLPRDPPPPGLRARCLDENVNGEVTKNAKKLYTSKVSPPASHFDNKPALKVIDESVKSRSDGDTSERDVKEGGEKREQEATERQT